ncbi:hypothetical protein CY652_08895 [Burkholderia sp. WAC0059]|uniref:hypothetical protein n=1 Tax=Burkholderia sp. WAC0059 TaxID=2066022 RepID=UPI000C7F75BC|nr:hypothetical protein [Burkholderia sp. WAC0059]PLZ02647.1 hypothetical protein CY652_08895 [Burkholderia sp. WAC0059]
MKDSFIVVLAGAGALLAYLGSSRQRWLRRPWPARPTRVAATLCLLAACGLGAQARPVAAALSLVVTVVMACLSASPFVGLLVERWRHRVTAHGR